jgi:branched-chain amino acid transport system substrate-binding protein
MTLARNCGRTGALAASLAALAAAGSSCRQLGSVAAGTARDTAYVGVAVGLQSPERYVDVFNGVQMALDELNAHRAAGTPVLALRRAPEAARATIQVATAFRDDPSVIGIVGHTESDPTISAAAVYDDHEHGGRNAIVAVSPTAGADGVTRASRWVFRVCPVVSQQAVTLARYITDSLHRERIAIIYRNDVSGRDFLGTFGSIVKIRHGTLLERDPFAEELAEFDLYAARLARSKPDAVMAFANSSDVRKIVRALRAAGTSPIVVSTNGPTRDELARDTGAVRDFTGLKYLALYLADRPVTPAGLQFANEFLRRFGRKPDHWSALSYDAAMLIGRAEQAVGPDRAKIRDWIAAVGRSQPAYIGATGEIRFDDQRNPIDKPALVATVTR